MNFETVLKIYERRELAETYPKNQRGKDWVYCPGFVRYVPTVKQAMYAARVRAECRCGFGLKQFRWGEAVITIPKGMTEKYAFAHFGFLKWKIKNRAQYAGFKDVTIQVIEPKPRR